MKALLIAEKPSLMKEIKNVYNKIQMKDEITFMCFAGHVMKLAKPGEYKEEWAIKKWNKEMLPIIPEKFKCVVAEDKKTLFNDLKKEVMSGKYDYLINACDPDREAQLIFKNFTDYLNCKLPVKRFWTNDLTSKSIENTLLNLRDNDNEPFLKNLTIASKLRAEFDWLVGMNLSVAATLKMGDTCHIGRVKMPTLKILVDRELEIRNFKSTTSYEVEGIFDGYKGIYFDQDGNVRFKTKEEAEKFLTQIPQNAIIESVVKKTENSKAPQLYCLNTLQQDGNKLFGYTAEKTKMLAQSLYEKKILSYPRSDNPYISTELAKEFTKLCRTVEEIDELKEYAKIIARDKDMQLKVAKNEYYVNDKKMAESGHYAITPTGIKPNMDSLTEDEKNILVLVCKRFVSIFLPPIKSIKTTIITKVGEYLFKTNGKEIIDIGYMVLYPNRNNEKSNEELIKLPNVKDGQQVLVEGININEKISVPPPRYTEASLLAAMVNPIKFLKDDTLKQKLKEVKGIGTEATRDGMISELVKNKYIERKKKNIVPSEKSIEIIQNLHGRNIISVDLTGIWENKLSEIEKGTLNPNEFKKEMIEYVLSEIKSIDNTQMKMLQKSNKKEKIVIGKCIKCGANVIEGKSYYLCENYKKDSNGCDFVIKKNIMGTNLTKADVSILLKGGATKEKILTKKDNTKITKKFVLNDNGELAIEKPKVIAICPICGDEVINSKYYLCRKYKKGCTFIIPKTFGEAEITIDDLKVLIEGKQTPTKKSCKWKSGKTSSVYLKLDNEFKISPVFDENKPKQVIKEIGICPKCKGKVLSSNNFYYCENHPSNCNFSIKKEIKGAIIGEKEINHLLNGEPTDLLMFKWNEKKSSEARIIYKEKIEFIFD